MHPHLEKLNQQLASALAGLTEAQTQLRPGASPRKWNIQQIADHLCRTYAATEEVIALRIERAVPTKAHPSLHQRLGQFMIITLGRFPSGYASPAAVAPPDCSLPRSGAELHAQAGQGIARIDTLGDRAEALFGSRRSVSHMVLGPLSIPQWRRFHLVHGLHHCKQILAIRRDHHL